MAFEDLRNRWHARQLRGDADVAGLPPRGRGIGSVTFQEPDAEDRYTELECAP